MNQLLFGKGVLAASFTNKASTRNFAARLLSLVGAVLAVLLSTRAQAQQVVTNCTEQDFRNALAVGGLVSFTNACNITLSGPIVIGSGSTTIDSGGNAVMISGSSSVQLFVVAGTLRLVGLTLANGRSTNGGALYVDAGATVVATNCIFTGNTAVGAAGVNGSIGSNVSSGQGRPGGNGTAGAPGLGGAIYNLGTVDLLNCTFTTNSATGGNGGNGGGGGSGGGTLGQGGNGGSGGSGASGRGGAIHNQGTLSLFNCTLSANSAQGGSGGNGGTNGPGNFPGMEGAGGGGASGAGGAIYNALNASIIACTFNGNTATGGTSAAGGNRTSGVGTTGNNGGDAIGGALCSVSSGGVTNCTFYGNSVTGGQGGDGGDGSGTLRQGGNGGNGGNGFGGALENEGTLTLVNCTLANCTAAGGTNGVAGRGTFAGTDGHPGGPLGGGLARIAGTLTLFNCILSTNTPGANGYGPVIDKGYNISSDPTVASSSTSRANTDPALGTLANNGGATMTMALLTGSPAINLIPPNNGSFPATDERGISRPQGTGADAGAYEFSFATVFSIVQPTLLSGQIALVYPTSATATYVLKYKNDLNNSTWTPFITNFGTGGLITNVDFATNQVGRFYGVFLQ